jgi:hypothetical protein
MRRLGFAPLRPRPRHRQADPGAQAAFKKTLPDGFLAEAALPLAIAGGMGFCCAPAGAQAHPPAGMGPAGPGAAPLSPAVVRPGTGESEYGLPGAVLFCPHEGGWGGQAAGWAGTPPDRCRCQRAWGFVFCRPARLSCSRWNLGADGWGGGQWAGGGRSGAVEQGGSPLRLPADPACAHTEPHPVSLVAGGMLRERFRRISYHLRSLTLGVPW